MKLVEILARELKEWPDIGTDVVGQASDGSLHLNASTENNRGFTEEVYGLAEDWRTQDVTRAQWEAEKARIAEKIDGGWVRNRGRSGKCPVADGTLIDVRYRNGWINERVKAMAHTSAGGSIRGPIATGWNHFGSGLDIMAWKLHKPAEQPEIEQAVVENVQAFNAQAELLYDPVAQGPIQWRDRIRTLDAKRAELEETYQREIGEISKERGELVGCLAGEGLALVEVVHPVEDMSDWRNWKVGDLVVCIDSQVPKNEFTPGSKYVIDYMEKYWCNVVEDDEGDENALPHESFKWHSRPAK